MNTFYEDFTNDLRLCAGPCFHSSPLDHWDPLEVAAPERHLSLGTEPWEDRVEALERHNPAFAQIESMLHLYFKGEDQVEDDPIDSEKEQVWLFAYHWFATYYELLMDTRSTKTEFYKKYHEAFLALMRRCLRIQPVARPTFREIANLWLPAICREIFNKTPEAAAEAPKNAAEAPKNAALSPTSRVVLVGARGHNKTRRNPRS
jgi:hypothetical protein